MTALNLELWLIVQLLIETGLCALLLYFIFEAKHLRKEIMLEKEKMKKIVETAKPAIDGMHRLIKKTEDLEKKRHKTMELWGRIEEKGAVLASRIDRYKASCAEMASGSNAYDKVSRLIEKGLSASQISQKLGLPQGEVELVMKLKRQ